MVYAPCLLAILCTQVANGDCDFMGFMKKLCHLKTLRGRQRWMVGLEGSDYKARTGRRKTGVGATVLGSSTQVELEVSVDFEGFSRIISVPVYLLKERKSRNLDKKS